MGSEQARIGGQLLQRLGESKHASLLLVTSRERPKGLARLEEDRPTVRSLRLAGLDVAAGQALLTARGLPGNGVHGAALVASYSGNPLALNVVAVALTAALRMIGARRAPDETAADDYEELGEARAQRTGAVPV